ncbi:LodA/GoxA family CTQ-dependent oxidase [Mesorhizobium sp. M1307]|uniref:LodA/GoxA family CTQ-dependent oxidase n=1 Tax=Mesorhizobium sp. M1307 TaxID=2957079 RepID=UPI003338B12E
MSKVYKIHPGMGIMRVGPSKLGFFLAAETGASQAIDIDTGGSDVPFTGYKDAAMMMRRQGARFRVYEYDRNDATGALSWVREVTADDATIEWSVKLTASKAAGKLMGGTTGPDGNDTIVPGQSDRNDPPAGFTRADLAASVDLSVTGRNAGPAPGAEPVARIVGRDLFIGEARTDAAGRLIVLAGRGVANSWETPLRRTENFLNNPTWYDDVADGSVDAIVTLPGASPVSTIGAWVFAAPPDFAPDIYPLTTLLDIAEQAVNVPLPNPLTYPQDIEPLLKRAGNLYFVSKRNGWGIVKKLLETSTDLGKNDAGAKPQRSQLRDAVIASVSQMSRCSLTTRQQAILRSWVDGAFDEHADAGRSPSPAEDLDRTSLEHCVGGGFLPGIEAGTVLRQATIYSEFGRITRGTFSDWNGETYQMDPGLISSRMACPWQADFTECNTNWWPAQRPDWAGRNTAGQGVEWDRGIIVSGNDASFESHKNMIDHFAQLGVVVRSGNNFIEIDRDPSLDTGV